MHSEEFFEPWQGQAYLDLCGSIWSISPSRCHSRTGGVRFVSNRNDALVALQKVDELWSKRRQHPQQGGGLLLGSSYEFGSALQGINGLDTKQNSTVHNEQASKAEQGYLRWFECLPCDSRDLKPFTRSLNVSTNEPEEPTQSEVNATLSFVEYSKRFERIKSDIAAGNYYQLNLCRHFEVKHPPTPVAVWDSLSRAKGAPAAMAAIWDAEAWLSFSPEPFLCGELGGEIKTVPIKGTRPRGRTSQEDDAYAEALLQSSKDRAELMMIVDLERNDLTQICQPGTISRLVKPELHKYSEVMHLLASVKGKLKPEVGITQMFCATFPGGSITGAPKRAVMQAIQELEPRSRGLFTGSLWWLGDDGRFASSITIRTLEWLSRDRVQFGAGGGVTWNSSLNAEWEEANAKARPFAHALGFNPEEH